MRRVLLFVTAAGVIAALAALSAGGHSRAAPATRFAPTFGGSLAWRNQAPPRAFTLSAPVLHSGTCWVASGRCSLTPCVDPVAAVPVWPLNGPIVSPARRPAAHACRRPKAPRSRTSSA
jgi:hypothetical protein